MKKIALNVNFDSLYFPLSIDRKRNLDPSFFKVADRFFSAALKYNFKFSIYIIGRDLENPEVAARVREWSQAGHEIGNHSWTHHGNLGACESNKQRDEIMRSHYLISKTIGQEPKGYISPTWSMSPTSIQTLIDLDYLYDTSAFPSPVLLPAILKLKFNSRTDEKFDTRFSARRDKQVIFWGPRKPYFVKPESLSKPQEDGLLMLPLPTAFRLPVWHTMAFMWPMSIHKWLIKMAMKKPGFYYLMHPADIADFREDFDHNVIQEFKDEISVFERMDVPLNKKLALFDSVMEFLTEHRELVTVFELAQDIINKKIYIRK